MAKSRKDPKGRGLPKGESYRPHKDVLGMYVGQNESVKFWLSILNVLKNRGVEDILIACVDGLTGFPQAIETVFSQTEIQQCIIHQIRNTTKFVSYKELKPLMADLYYQCHRGI